MLIQQSTSGQSHWHSAEAFRKRQGRHEAFHFTWTSKNGTYLATRNVAYYDSFERPHGWFFYSNNGDFTEKNIEGFRFLIPEQNPSRPIDEQFGIEQGTLTLHYFHYDEVDETPGIREYTALTGQCTLLIEPEKRFMKGTWEANFGSPSMPWANGEFFTPILET